MARLNVADTSTKGGEMDTICFRELFLKANFTKPTATMERLDQTGMKKLASCFFLQGLGREEREREYLASFGHERYKQHPLTPLIVIGFLTCASVADAIDLS